MQKNTSRLISVFRLIRLLLHVLSGLIQSIIYPRFSRATQRRMMQHWAKGLLKALNIHLSCNGAPPAVDVPRALFAANHVSWLDICVMMAACPTRFVAKSEISGWPVLGLLCRNTGTLFIERSKRSDTMRINQSIGEVLATGERVTIFPEGTTSDGSELKHFHASLLQSAVTMDALLYPVAIRYCNMAGDTCKEAAYLDPSLVLSLKQILNQPRIDVQLSFSDPIQSGGKNRRELARLSEQAIADALSLPIPHREPGKLSDPLSA
ncbi:MAG: 1-acyl-sn-glycerol-3-phosphate acyltransferase [Betaproteobacteria bacterium]|nr:1-acyl-sn-glycerol-3-phosphate acyltransferase [Betaproteobacteria bacterium]